MRESINLLWLKRPCYDLTLRQRFHAETEPLLWLKAECNDLTLPLVCLCCLFCSATSILVGGVEHFLFSHILGIIIPNWLSYFFRGGWKPPTSWPQWLDPAHCESAMASNAALARSSVSPGEVEEEMMSKLDRFVGHPNDGFNGYQWMGRITTINSDKIANIITMDNHDHCIPLQCHCYGLVQGNVST